MEQSQERQTSVIRRIYLGPDYLKSMKYTVGSPCLKGTATIYEISQTEVSVFEVHVKNEDNEVILWKTISNMPVCLEYNIDLF